VVSPFAAPTRLSDTWVRDLTPGGAGKVDSNGIVIEQSVADLARVRVSRAVAASYSFTGGAVVRLMDVVAEDAKASATKGDGGHGITMSTGASVSVSRAAFLRCRDTGVVVGSKSSLALLDVQIMDTMPADCMATRCQYGSPGYGLAVSSALAAVKVRRFAIERSAAVGVRFDEGQIRLEQGRISGSQIAVQIGTSSASIAWFADRVELDAPTKIQSLNGMSLESCAR
jgi:hypothetical protein